MLRVLTLENQTEWEQIVKSFKDYDIYWLPGYVKAFKIHGDGEPKLFYYENGSGTRAINVVMLRDIHDFALLAESVEPNTWFDIVTPYGYGGWLIEGEGTPFAEYDAYCKEQNIVSEFVRFHPIVKNHERCAEYYGVIQLGNTVAIDLSSPDVIWANFKTNCRGKIKKAQKNGIIIKHGRSLELFEEFRKIYNETMDKDSAEDYYYFGPEFYESVYKDLPETAQIFYAELEGRIIAASIMLSENGRINYHLSGSLREFAHLAPTNLLLYETALWGSEQGYKSLYLGGGVGSGEDNLYEFKKGFYRGEEFINRFCIGKKIFNEDKYNELVNNRKNLPESGYFPKYRILE